jgi:hypothetical protein
MKSRFAIFALIAAALLLLLVVLGWYASENFSGRLGRRLIELGDFVIWPGRLADGLLSGSFGGFGGWRSGGIRIVVSWLAWTSPVLLGGLLDRLRNHTTKPRAT